MKTYTAVLSARQWSDFMEDDRNRLSFRQRRWPVVQRVAAGDRLLVYLHDEQKYVGLLEATGEPTRDDVAAWDANAVACHVPVKRGVVLVPAQGVPIQTLDGVVSFKVDSDEALKNYFRATPIQDRDDDGAVIARVLQDANRMAARTQPLAAAPSEDELEALFSDDLPPATLPEAPTPDPLPAPSAPARSATPATRSTAPRPQVPLPEAGSTASDIMAYLVSLGQTMGVRVQQADADYHVAWYDAQGDLLRGFVVLDGHDLVMQLLDLNDQWLSDQATADVMTLVGPGALHDAIMQTLARPTFARHTSGVGSNTLPWLPYEALHERVAQAEELGFLRYLQPAFLDELIMPLGAE